MALVRINFGISQIMREWLVQQAGIVRIVSSDSNETIIEHNLSGAQAIALRQAFIDKLIESI